MRLPYAFTINPPFHRNPTCPTRQPANHSPALPLRRPYTNQLRGHKSTKPSRTRSRQGQPTDGGAYLGNYNGTRSEQGRHSGSPTPTPRSASSFRREYRNFAGSQSDPRRERYYTYAQSRSTVHTAHQCRESEQVSCATQATSIEPFLIVSFLIMTSTALQRSVSITVHPGTNKGTTTVNTNSFRVHALEGNDVGATSGGERSRTGVLLVCFGVRAPSLNTVPTTSRFLPPTPFPSVPPISAVHDCG